MTTLQGIDANHSICSAKCGPSPLLNLDLTSFSEITVEWGHNLSSKTQGATDNTQARSSWAQRIPRTRPLVVLRTVSLGLTVMESITPFSHSSIAHLSQDVWNDLLGYLEFADVCNLFTTKSKLLMTRVTARDGLKELTMRAPLAKSFTSASQPTYAEFRFFLHSLANLEEFSVVAPFYINEIDEITPKILNLVPFERLRRLRIHGNIVFSEEITKSIAELCPSLEKLRMDLIPLKFSLGSLLSAIPPTLDTLRSSSNASSWDWHALPNSITKLSLIFKAEDAAQSTPHGIPYTSMAALTRLPNLRSLHIRSKDAIALQSSYGPELVFPSLEELHWEELGSSGSGMSTFPTIFMATPVLHSLALSKASGSFMWSPASLPSTLTHLSFLANGRAFGRQEPLNLIAVCMLCLPPSLKRLFMIGNVQVETSAETKWFENLPAGLKDLMIPPQLMDWAHLPTGLERLNCHPNSFYSSEDPFKWQPARDTTSSEPASTMLPVTALPRTLVELHLAPPLLHPSQLELLPPSIRKLTLRNSRQWHISHVKTLLEMRPSLELLRLTSTLELPSPPQDGRTKFDMIAYTKEAVGSILTRDEKRRIDFTWSLPSSNGLLMLPDSLTELNFNAPDFASHHQPFGLQIGENEIHSILSANLQRLPALRSLIVTAARTSRGPLDISRELAQMHSLEVLHMEISIATFRFDILPRSLKELRVSLQKARPPPAPHGTFTAGPFIPSPKFPSYGVAASSGPLVPSAGGPSFASSTSPSFSSGGAPSSGPKSRSGMAPSVSPSLAPSGFSASGFSGSPAAIPSSRGFSAQAAPIGASVAAPSSSASFAVGPKASFGGTAPASAPFTSNPTSGNASGLLMGSGSYTAGKPPPFDLASTSFASAAPAFASSASASTASASSASSSGFSSGSSQHGATSGGFSAGAFVPPGGFTFGLNGSPSSGSAPSPFSGNASGSSLGNFNQASTTSNGTLLYGFGGASPAHSQLGPSGGPSPFVGTAANPNAHMSDIDPSLLPPSLTIASILGIKFTQTLALKFPQSLKELVIETEEWSDLDVHRLRRHLPVVEKLTVRGFLIISGSLELEILKDADPSTQARLQPASNATSLVLYKEYITQLLKPATGFVLQIGPSSFNHFPQSLTKLELFDWETHESAAKNGTSQSVLEAPPASWPPNLEFMSLDLGSSTIELDDKITYIRNMALKQGAEPVRVLPLPPRLVTLIVAVRSIPRSLGQFEALPRTLKHLWIAPNITRNESPLLCPSSQVLSTLPRGLEALHLPFFSFEPSDMEALPAGLQQIRFHGGENWTDSAIARVAQVCAASYSASPSDIFTDPSLSVFINKARHGSDELVAYLHLVSPWSDLVAATRYDGPLFVAVDLASFTGQGLVASKTLKVEEMLENTSRALCQNGAHTRVWSTHTQLFTLPSPETIENLDLSSAKQSKSGAEPFLHDISQLPQLPSMTSLRCLSLYFIMGVDHRRLFSLLPQALEHLSIVTERPRETDWALLPRGLKSLAIWSVSTAYAPQTQLAGIPPNLEALLILSSIALTSLHDLPPTLKYLWTPTYLGTLLCEVWERRGLDEVPNTTDLTGPVSTASLPWWPKF